MKKISQTIKRKDDLEKQYTQKYHFIKRMRERLGIRVTDEMYDHMCSCIKNEKKSDLFELEHLYDQSNRLMVFELRIPNKVPVNIIYDKSRKSIVTILFQKDEDEMELNFYYDVFLNKVMLKHDLGYNRGWILKDGVLEIPAETLEHGDKYSEVVSEGILYGKRFKVDKDTIFEVM